MSNLSLPPDLANGLQAANDCLELLSVLRAHATASIEQRMPNEVAFLNVLLCLWELHHKTDLLEEIKRASTLEFASVSHRPVRLGDFTEVCFSLAFFEVCADLRTELSLLFFKPTAKNASSKPHSSLSAYMLKEVGLSILDEIVGLLDTYIGFLSTWENSGRQFEVLAFLMGWSDKLPKESNRSHESTDDDPAFGEQERAACAKLKELPQFQEAAKAFLEAVPVFCWHIQSYLEAMKVDFGSVEDFFKARMLIEFARVARARGPTNQVGSSAPNPANEGPHPPHYFVWKGKKHRVGTGRGNLSWRLLAYFWIHDSATFEDLQGPGLPWSDPVSPSAIRTAINRFNVDRPNILPWKLATKDLSVYRQFPENPAL